MSAKLGLSFLGIGMLLLLASPPSGFAHGGGLDKIGCHHDRKNGGYHCHRGPLAGQKFSTKEEALRALELQQKEQAAKKEEQKGDQGNQTGGK